MVNKNIDQQLSTDWEKAAAWAQTLGIKKDTLAPVFAYDQQRVANGDFPMSPAERNRAILAAAHPNNVTPVPADHPSPISFIGNARTDLANIFTGLAPNHLIPNIFKTAETAILHPSTWLKPVEDVGKGIVKGNIGDIKKGLALAGGQNSILSWIPGVYDLSELAQGGVNAVLTHPIVSLLDAAPFAPAGKVLSLAADEAQMGSIASRLGFSSGEALQSASIPQMASKWAMSRDIAKDQNGQWVPTIPGIGKLTQTLVGPDGKPLSVSGAFQQWGQAHTGLSKAASYIAAGTFDLRSYGTDAELYTVRPLQIAEEALSPGQKKEVEGLVYGTDPKSQGKSVAEVMADSTIDPKVRTAYELHKDVLAQNESQSLASGNMVAVHGPDIKLKDNKVIHQVDYFSVLGQKDLVVGAARQAKVSLGKLIKAMGPAHKISLEVAKLDKDADIYAGELEKARQAALKTDLKGNTAKVAVDAKHGVALPISRQRDLLMGEDGLVSKIAEAASGVDQYGNPKERDFETLKALTGAAKRDMTKEGYGRVDASIDPTLARVAKMVDTLDKYAARRITRERQFLSELSGDVPKLTARRHNETTEQREARYAANARRTTIKSALKKALADYRDFNLAWWDNPADRWRPVLYEKMIENILQGEYAAGRIDHMTDRLKELGYADKQIDKMRTDPKILAEAIWHETKNAASNVGGHPILDDEDIARIYYDAVEHVNSLRHEGYEISYVPVVSSENVSAYDPGRYGVGVASHGIARDLSSTKKRNMTDFMPERYDLMAAVHLSTKEAIQRNITIEFADTHLASHAKTAGEVAEWAQKAFREDYAGRNPADRNQADLVAEHVSQRLGLKKWDPNLKMGFSLPRWKSDAIYLPAGLADAVDKLLTKTQFPLDGLYDKGTNLFRFSILALSPRYTAHIVFGGAFLLALRSDPRIVTKMLEAHRIVKDGEMPIRLRQGSTERGIEPVQYRTFTPATAQKVGLEQVNKSGATQLAHMVVQEALGKDGILWSKASPLQWVKAVGELNYRFTNHVSSMYRAAAMLDYSAKAEKRGTFFDESTGQRVAMTKERAQYEGIHHALKVMGDLKAMTPLERTAFMRIMPFYGWTRHILNYVLTYPVDHPYRAQFLSVLAEQDSDSVAKALDTRILFMFFMGNPDKTGNVSGVDVRFMDPLRDVANYASLGGWIGALNPVISAPLAYLDPNLIYGSTSLYPSVTYNQFYGIETSTNPGGGWNAVEQVVPQLTALDAAIGLSSNYRSLAQHDPTGFAKTVFNSLNIPFAQVQHVNMKELAAKGEIARYDVGKAAAASAWSAPNMGGTGIEKALSGYTSVPSPLNADYEITPAQLQAIYNQALQEFPGQAPADVIGSVANPPGF